jgi:Ser/Thr protein kinase RdoA (MazF antagonist)
VASAFGLGGDAVLDGPVARGEVGQVWRLSTPVGTFAVKQPFEPPSTAEAVDDARFQDAAKAAGVALPAVVRAPNGAVVVDIDGRHFRLYAWVDLLDVDRQLDPCAVGAAVASIHRVVYRGATGVHAWYTDAVGEQAWDELIAQLVAADAPFASRFAARRDEIVALERFLDPPSELQTCHRDLFADNVRGTPGGEVCVIDWENSGLADPSQELALVLFEFAGADADRARALLDDYRACGGTGSVDLPQSFSMVIAQLGHIAELSCRRWLDPLRSEERQRNAGRIEEFLSDGITLGLVDTILDAVAR